MNKDRFNAAKIKLAKRIIAALDNQSTSLNLMLVSAARELIDAAGEIENVENKPPAEYVTDIKFHRNGTVDVFYTVTTSLKPNTCTNANFHNDT